jgi:Protein of unknown function (DUF2442)
VPRAAIVASEPAPTVEANVAWAVDGEYRLRLTFEDGTVGDADFSGREWRGVFERLNDPAEFARVEVDAEAGTITWPGGMDMAPEPLYAEARRHLVHGARAGG